jgi:dihydroflavonol-4-reductase
MDDHEYDESMWTDLPAAENNALIKSKTLAERAAWDIQQKLEAEGLFCPEIVTINPNWIVGETIGAGVETSISFVRRWIMNEMSGYPNMRMACVDIKDVSKAHVRALERPNAANKRFILSQDND